MWNDGEDSRFPAIRIGAATIIARVGSITAVLNVAVSFSFFNSPDSRQVSVANGFWKFVHCAHHPDGRSCGLDSNHHHELARSGHDQVRHEHLLCLWHGLERDYGSAGRHPRQEAQLVESHQWRYLR